MRQKIILIALCLLLFFNFLSSEVRIMGSIFGAISDPVSWKEFSCINFDGTLNEERWERFMILFAGDGASATREITFLLPEKDIEFNRSYLPFVFRDGKYDLEQLNPLFFENLRRMVLIANRYKIKFYFSLFDRCHGKFKHSPWRLNHQGIDGFYNLPDKFLVKYIKNVVDKIKYVEWGKQRTKIGFEVVNEPFSPDFGNFCVKVVRYLKARGIPTIDIIPGYSYFPLGNPVEKAYKKSMRDAGIYDKYAYYSVSHGFGSLDFILNKWVDLQKHLRPFYFSDDGCHPKHSREWWEKNLFEYFNGFPRKPKKNKAFKNNWIIEHIYRFSEDDIHGCQGISKAIKKYIGHWPKNYLWRGNK